jgi:hypothetical protein
LTHGHGYRAILRKLANLSAIVRRIRKTEENSPEKGGDGSLNSGGRGHLIRATIAVDKPGAL